MKAEIWYSTEYVFRRTKFRWWSKYNFVLSAGLDVGTVISAIVIFLTVQLPRPGADGTLNWWGNTVYVKLSSCCFCCPSSQIVSKLNEFCFRSTDDFDGTPYLDPPVEGFGPLKW